MIWENGPQSLPYAIEFEWHHPTIRLSHTQDIECLLRIVWKIFLKTEIKFGACKKKLAMEF